MAWCRIIHSNVILPFPSDAAPTPSSSHSHLSLPPAPPLFKTTKAKKIKYSHINYFNYYISFPFFCLFLFVGLLSLISFDDSLDSFFQYPFIRCVFFQISFSSASRRACGPVSSHMTMEEKPLSESRMLVSLILLFSSLLFFWGLWVLVLFVPWE